ncbi:hypothetical protein HD593_008300 [Nonomuraea rubra]|uniref:Uncharacterized protein n=1 Tax=Nonomuraea rubra TaxID=46180 RepID=A0A7X0P1E7_9ACTN|nr:hypothetical protein [Nonomuraea rubra]
MVFADHRRERGLRLGFMGVTLCNPDGDCKTPVRKHI